MAEGQRTSAPKAPVRRLANGPRQMPPEGQRRTSLCSAVQENQKGAVQDAICCCSPHLCGLRGAGGRATAVCAGLWQGPSGVRVSQAFSGLTGKCREGRSKHGDPWAPRPA